MSDLDAIVKENLQLKAELADAQRTIADLEKRVDVHAGNALSLSNRVADLFCVLSTAERADLDKRVQNLRDRRLAEGIGLAER